MAMKPALTLKLGQQLRMTPQLQQAIRLLQLSSLDLQHEIQEALDSNLMLEELSPNEDAENEGVEPTSLDPPKDDFTADEDAIYDKNDASGEELAEAVNEELPPQAPDPELDGEDIPDTHEQVSDETMREDLPVDIVWEDVFDDNPFPTSYSAPEDDTDYLDSRNSEAESLQTHLLDQISLMRLTDADTLIAMAILDGLDDEGVLNGYRANFAANRNEAHYKNKGVANGIAEGTAKYMLHSNIEDRRRLCEKLLTRKTSICSVVKVIEAYRKEQATLTQQNRIDARGVNRYGSGHGSRVLVIDSNGVLH